MNRVVLAALAVSLCACAAKYHVIATEAESPVLGGDCVIRVLEAAPEEAYRVVGTVEPDDPAKLAESEDAYVSSFREAACKRTANAIIVSRDPAGRYGKATLIRIR